MQRDGNVANGGFTKALGVLLILATSSLAFCAGGYVGQITFEPQVIVDHQIVSTIIERAVYEPVEVEKVIVEQVEVSKELHYFESLDELEQWLSSVSIFASDCDDFAIELQNQALKNSYIVSFEVIYPSEYNRLFKQKRLPGGIVHAINLAVIGNEVYYIEPQTHEVVFAAYLD